MMSKFFARVGFSLWVLLAATALLVWFVGSLQGWSLPESEWKDLGIWLGGGGFVSLTLAIIFSMWESD